MSGSGLFRVERQALFLDFGLVGIQLILGGTMYSRTIPEFSEALQLDCLLKVTVVVTETLAVPLRLCRVSVTMPHGSGVLRCRWCVPCGRR